MKELWRVVDRMLRDRQAVASEEALGRTKAAWLAGIILLLGAAYGVFMGVYGLSSREVLEYRQMVSSMWKVPALFLLTLLICFPSLYVFSTMKKNTSTDVAGTKV